MAGGDHQPHPLGDGAGVLLARHRSRDHARHLQGAAVFDSCKGQPVPLSPDGCLCYNNLSFPSEWQGVTTSLTLSVTVLVSCSLDTDKARAALQVCAARTQQVPPTYSLNPEP